MNDIPRVQWLMQSGRYLVRRGILTGNTYLIPAFVHLTAESRHLQRQGTDGLRCRVHIQADATTKSL